jgi:hypothetical protein
MAIMAIISAAILGTASAAMEAARRTRTQSLVSKIHGLLTQQLASYETRRVDIAGQWVNGPDGVETKFRKGDINVIERGQMMADLQLLAKRELIKYEMPDRWTDVDEPNVFLSRQPAVTQAYFRRLKQMRAASAQSIAPNQGAECLYLTIMNNTGDGEARTMFSKQDIGDTDEDGAPEFIDGWGNPIAWLRWPAGFVARSPLMSADAQADHDPIDVYRRDDAAAVRPLINQYPSAVQAYVARLDDLMPAFRLIPLVYSSGADGISDINTLGPTASAMDRMGIALDPYALESPNDPYHVTDNPFQVGYAVDDANSGDGDDNFKDNIHSHLIEY